jgi:hypothetical protein
MLFDLRGKRRRAVQATYLTLALLMGGGLVFFGVGGDVSGGLLDAFKGGGGGSNGNELVQKRIDKNEKRLQASPKNTALLADLTRDYYQLGQSKIPQGQTISDDARPKLNQASAYWKRYLGVVGQDAASASLANTAVQLYGPDVLNKPKDGVTASTIVAKEVNNSEAYLRVVQFAAIAGDKRTANLAAIKAVDLAPKGQKKQVKTLVKQLQQSAAQPQVQQGG